MTFCNLKKKLTIIILKKKSCLINLGKFVCNLGSALILKYIFLTPFKCQACLCPRLSIIESNAKCYYAATYADAWFFLVVLPSKRLDKDANHN